MVELNEVQRAYVLALLFGDLREAAQTLAQQAAGAAEGNAEGDNLAGDDALSTCVGTAILQDVPDDMLDSTYAQASVSRQINMSRETCEHLGWVRGGTACR
jgi:hypothetical protein